MVGYGQRPLGLDVLMPLVGVILARCVSIFFYESKILCASLFKSVILVCDL